MENTNSKAMSFRGMPIPEINIKPNYQIADSKQVIDKISKMDSNQQKNITLSAVHYNDRDVSDVKLSTGDIVPVETAIALAENSMLAGYVTGTTRHGGKTLKASPGKDSGKSIHTLPKF